jgi:hypothetical protein
MGHYGVKISLKLNFSLLEVATYCVQIHKLLLQIFKTFERGPFLVPKHVIAFLKLRLRGVRYLIIQSSLIRFHQITAV